MTKAVTFKFGECYKKINTKKKVKSENNSELKTKAKQQETQERRAWDGNLLQTHFSWLQSCVHRVMFRRKTFFISSSEKVLTAQLSCKPNCKSQAVCSHEDWMRSSSDVSVGYLFECKKH